MISALFTPGSGNDSLALTYTSFIYIIETLHQGVEDVSNYTFAPFGLNTPLDAIPHVGDRDLFRRRLRQR